jgi:hypothetical protein
MRGGLRQAGRQYAPAPRPWRGGRPYRIFESIHQWIYRQAQIGGFLEGGADAPQSTGRPFTNLFRRGSQGRDERQNGGLPDGRQGSYCGGGDGIILIVERLNEG